MKQKITTFILILILTLIPITTNGATYSSYEDYAKSLRSLGIFVGTDTGFELDRAPTRLEGIAMLVRLLGVEDEAMAMKGTAIPFTDVPYWGSGYVAYAYKNGLTYGISKTKFGSSNSIDAKAYLTFLLRSLGYNDVAGDFNYSNALQFSKDLGLLNTELYNTLLSNPFLRAHVAVTSYDALKFPTKGTDVPLIDKLMAEGKIDIPDFGKLAGCNTLYQSEDSYFYSILDFEMEDYLTYIDYLNSFGFNDSYSFNSEATNDIVYVYENNNLGKSIMLSFTEISGISGLLIITNY